MLKRGTPKDHKRLKKQKRLERKRHQNSASKPKSVSHTKSDTQDGTRSLVREKMGLDQTPDEKRKLVKNEIVPIAKTKATDVMARDLPEPFDDMMPGITVVLGSVKTGKTVLFLNLVLRPELHGDLYDKLVVCSPTAALDSSWEVLVNVPGIEFHEMLTPKVLQSVKQRQLDYQDTHRGTRLHQALVIDDAVMMASTCGTFKRDVAGFATAFRHYVDGMYMLTQSMKAVCDPVFRGNVAGWVVMHGTTPNERFKLWDELFEHFDMPNAKELDKLFTMHIRKKHDFMFINMHKGSIYRCFTKRIFTLHAPQDDEEGSPDA